jgi:hypothetical protein
MRSIDIHAHLTLQCFWRATERHGPSRLRRTSAMIGVLPSATLGSRWSARRGRYDALVAVDGKLAHRGVGHYTWPMLHIRTRIPHV